MARIGHTGRRPLIVVLTALVLGVFAVAPGRAATSDAGQLYAFGLNVDGQLGNATNNGTSTANPTPSAVPLPGSTGPVVQVAAGETHSLAVTSTGQLYAFGSNYYGQLGSTGGNGQSGANPRPSLVTLPGATGPVVQAAAGSDHSLAVTSTGQLFAFGDNAAGELGSTANLGPHPTPALVSLPQPVVSAAAADFDSFAVTSAGQLYSWGNNQHGQLGYSTGLGTNNPTPTRVSLPPAAGGVVQVAAGDSHTLVLTSSGQVFAFGFNHYGELGNSTGNQGNSDYPVPTPVVLKGADGPAVQIAAGDEFSLALTSTGQLYTFGDDDHGQLGNGSEDPVPNPTPAAISLPPGAVGKVVQISAGPVSALAVSSSGQLYGFGGDSSGQLADPKLGYDDTPTLISLPGGAAADTVARGAEAYHSLVVLSDLTVEGPMPRATLAAPYRSQLRVGGGTAPYSVSAGGLPPGLSLDPATGMVSGTPTRTGSYTLRVTITDSDGITGSAQVGIDVALPALSALNASLHMASKGCGGPHHGGRHHHRCTWRVTVRVNYALTGPAMLIFSLERARPGRRIRGRCVAPTRRNRGRRSCVRTTRIRGTVTVQLATGSASLVLNGSFAGHALTVGTYRLTATPAAGESVSTPRTATFTIKR